MSYPWATGAWATGALASGSWDVLPSHAGVSWATNAWGPNTWASGSWLDSWVYAGSYSLNGQDITFKRTYIFPISSGSFLETGFGTTQKIPANLGSYSFAGQAIALVANVYRITQVNNLSGQVFDQQTNVQIQGTSLTGTTTARIEYAKGSALVPGSWGNAWTTGVWADGTLGIVSTNLTNVSVSNSTLVTADMFDVETSNIPYSDNNHTLHRLAITDGTRNNYLSTHVLPQAFNTIGTIQPSDANTIVGQSIFGGLTLNANQQVVLPVVVGGYNVSWETSNGNVTGRFSLTSGSLSSPVSLVIPIWDDVLGWDVINVTAKDIAAANINMPVADGDFSLSGQAVSWFRNYISSSVFGSFLFTGQDVGSRRGFVISPSSLNVLSLLSQSFVSNGTSISGIIGVGNDVIQSGSKFTVNGVGFGNDTSISVVLVGVLGANVECTINTINNSQLTATATSNSGALSSPIKLYVGDYQRNPDNSFVIVSGAPVPTSNRNASRNVSVIVFNIDSLTSTQLLNVPSITQATFTTDDKLVLATQLSNISLSGFTGSLISNGLISATTLAVPSLTAHAVLSVSGMTSATTLSSPTIAQHYGLYTASLVSTTTLENSTLHSNSLPVNSLSLATTLSNSSLIQHYSLSVSGLISTSTLGSSALNQKGNISAAGLTSTTLLGNVSLNYKAFIGTSSISCSTTLSNTSVIGRYSLAVDSSNCYTLIDSPSINNTYTLSVNNATIITALDNALLVQKTGTSPERLSLYPHLDKPTLTLRYFLDVDDVVLSERLSNSRSKTIPDPITVRRIYSTPSVSGTLHNN